MCVVLKMHARAEDSPLSI
uniref:Uncharacterized protein n=1 Tax=Anguilla anguilla TaxID=7936 RepID=A0A0E9RFD4_ANGAN